MHRSGRILLYLTFFHKTLTAEVDVFNYVDPLIGSTNGGNVFAGATLPYGMAKAVADVTGQNTAGFSADGSTVTGFSHTHDSGTGGYSSLGNFPLFPQLCPENALDECNFRIESRAIHHTNGSAVARPGYFALELESGVRAEMTVTQHTALYHFDFPSTGQKNLIPMVLLDLTDLWQSRQNATVHVDPDSGRISGSGTFLPSFGAGSYQLHYCVDFGDDAIIHGSGIWVNNRAGTEPKELFVTRGFNNFFLQAGGWVRFESPSDGRVSARVGISYISPQKACKNAEEEIPGPQYDFDAVRSKAEAAWRKKLSPISIVKTGKASTALLKTFWSAVYRTMINPQDLTGENPLWQSDEPYFDSFYCLWDSFRTQLPLLTIIDPHSLSRMVRSLLDTYQHEGWLPDCRMSLCKGWTQGGSNADVVIVDAYVKNLTGGIDWQLAKKAITQDAEHEPLEWSFEGRGGLQSWKRLNYIPYLDYDYLGFGTNSRSISRTVEYAYNDYCLATLLKGLGAPASEYHKYLTRAASWRNLYKADQRSDIDGKDSGFTGFFQPKYLNGTWGYQDPIACSPLTSFCSLTSNPSETFESSIWEYQFYTPHDNAALIKLLSPSSASAAAADQAFVDRLDYFHTSGLADIGNEPVFLTVFQYHYAGRPAKSAQRAHYYLDHRFNATHAGLPGNDDSGAMGAFVAFSMLGLFPVAGQSVYLITPPFFEEVAVSVPGTEKKATVRNVNFDPSYRDVFIQEARLNGKTYTKNWIGHEFFTEGMTLELVLGSKESAWGTKQADRPPSLSTGEMAEMAGLQAVRFR